MTSKKIDSRIKLLLDSNNVQKKRSIFAICGEKPHLVVPILFNFLRKPKGTVLWCFKKSPAHKEKKLKNKFKKRRVDPDEDPFELFIRSASIRWCYYNETDRILGNSYDLLVIQDFEALTPNVLARTIETVNGGGIVIFLLKSMESIECLVMDVHKKYQTEMHKDVVSRFNTRFISSLKNCKSFVAVDGLFNPLHIPDNIEEIESSQKPNQNEIKKLSSSFESNPLIGPLVNLCATLDQSKAVVSMIESLADKTLRTTVSLTASRGRGKSAALGLAVAGAIANNFCNIFVTSPSPENLKTFFEFVIKGLSALNLKQNFDFDVINSNEPSHNKSIVTINILNQFNQKIQYVPPKEMSENSLMKKSAELIIIDEAAAIPLPIVKSFLGPYLVFLSSTIDGYEGTGRALSIKLIEQLRNESNKSKLKEIKLEESIRYADGDQVEIWINKLLCLKNVASKKKKMDSISNIDNCALFYINRDVLFNHHPTSEKFLNKLMALYTSSHYKNSPNDLQMMADAPAHHLFGLLDTKDNVNKKDEKSNMSVPEVLCFIQVCLEGQISEYSVSDKSQNSKRPGDLIPWTLAQQFQDNKFPALSGARVVRIATNPEYVGQGYGRRALQLLIDYFEGKFINDPDTISHEDGSETKESHALLISLEERRPERLDYIGVCYGLTYDLYRFWKSSGFVPVYLRQTANELTGENSCIMIKFLQHRRTEFSNTISKDWLIEFWTDFRRRFVSLLDRDFKKLPIQLAYEVITSDKSLTQTNNVLLSPSEIDVILTNDDFSRYSSFIVNESVSLHGVFDYLTVLSYFYFTGRFTSELDKEVCNIMIGLGLQRKSLKEISKELSINHDTMTSNLRKGLKILSASFLKIKNANDKTKVEM
ncbi:RNA cytidine acetyltransferase-like [Tetranychus urticae]|uniref:RNA cytidine acetyltransferase-like n=1 Tax=Tetranychus urticae TaxID=32264 RepID=UPI00077B8E98|nr:RNA cytidine acetyltransferase-like [Tetranychus urticae]